MLKTQTKTMNASILASFDLELIQALTDLDLISVSQILTLANSDHKPIRTLANSDPISQKSLVNSDLNFPGSEFLPLAEVRISQGPNCPRSELSTAEVRIRSELAKVRISSCCHFIFPSPTIS